MLLWRGGEQMTGPPDHTSLHPLPVMPPKDHFLAQSLGLQCPSQNEQSKAAAADQLEASQQV